MIVNFKGVAHVWMTFIRPSYEDQLLVFDMFAVHRINSVSEHSKQIFSEVHHESKTYTTNSPSFCHNFTKYWPHTNHFETGEILRSCWLIQPNASEVCIILILAAQAKSVTTTDSKKVSTTKCDIDGQPAVVIWPSVP